ISEAVESVLRTVLQKRSEDRFASAEELSDAFFAAVTVAPVALPVSQTTGFMQPLFAASSALTQPQTPLPAVNPRAFVIDPQTPMPAFIALAPTAVSDAPSPFFADEERPLEQRAEPLLVPEEAADADKTQAYRKNFLAGEDEKKNVSQAWLVEPPEWSPLAIASSIEAPGAVPLTVDAYLRATPLAADALPESVALPENTANEEQKAPVMKHTWLTILVVAFLLLGLLGALLSTFIFPS
ncbi:MAG TPA: hypothetical protein VGU68_14705, partial [Ktedonobacteraceae bacterium]|nr:hypothetical protein [Ktedonobacteraceae bacterium]